MSDWIHQQAANVTAEEHEHARKEQRVREDLAPFWKDLERQLFDDVARINQNKTLVLNRLKGRELSIGILVPHYSTIRISRWCFPTFFVEVTKCEHALVILVKRELFLQGKDIERESLRVRADEKSQLYVRDAQGLRLSIPETSEYILTPLLTRFA